MVDNASAIAAVVVMTLATMLTRFSGVWIMSYVQISPRIEAFLKYMTASVLISIVVPTTLADPPRIWVAVVASVAVMIATRSTLAGMLAGTALAAAARAIGL